MLLAFVMLEVQSIYRDDLLGKVARNSVDGSSILSFGSQPF